MTKSSKRIEKLLKRPRDFSPKDLIVILEYYGFKIARKTPGGHYIYKRNADIINVPYKTKSLKRYTLEEAIKILKLEERG